LEQRRNILADVMSERTFPKFFGSIVIVLQRQAGDGFQLVRI
jgi:hypothetical protein